MKVLIICFSIILCVNAQSANIGCKVPDSLLLFLGLGECPSGSTNSQNIKFYLANRGHPDFIQIFQENDTNLSFYDVLKPACFVIHGWLQSYQSTWITFLKNQWLLTADCNVIVVDWSCLAVNYLSAATIHIKTVGDYLGLFIQSLNTRKNLVYLDTKIFGHSLGAHVAGLSGKYINNLQTTKIGIIFASDAAGVCVTQPEVNPCNFRLCSTDASFVEVFHCTDRTIGVDMSFGDADIYFNTGTNVQCGCTLLMIDGEIDQITKCEPLCSHENCNLYFIYSLQTKSIFRGKQRTTLGHSSIRSYFSIFNNCASNTNRASFYSDTTSVYITAGVHGTPLSGEFDVITTFDPPHCYQSDSTTCVYDPANTFHDGNTCTQFIQ